MTFPDNIDPRWVSTLSDDELQTAEWELRADFNEHESVEKERRGAAYDLMRGSAPLMRAWIRWSIVNAAARARGLRVRYRS